MPLESVYNSSNFYVRGAQAAWNYVLILGYAGVRKAEIKACRVETEAARPRPNQETSPELTSTLTSSRDHTRYTAAPVLAVYSISGHSVDPKYDDDDELSYPNP